MSSLVFPTLIGRRPNISRTAVYATGVQEAVSGVEYRANWRSRPRTRWGLEYEVLRSDLTNAEWQKLVGFFERHAGAYDSFLFTDPEDSTLTTQHNFGLGDGSTVDFQLQRSLLPSSLWSSPIKFWPDFGDGFEPVTALNGAPAIYKAGVLQTVSTDYAIGPTGVVTFVVAPGSAVAVTWTGSYYWRTRFATDALETQRIVQGLWESRRVELLQVF